MFPTYGSGIQQGYWDGNRFVAPPAQPTPQQQPLAVPLPQQPLLPQARPIQEPVRQGLLDGGDGQGGIGGPSPDTSGLGIGDVTGGVTGNLGSLGTALGMTAGLPGLGLMGALGQTSAETTGYQNTLAPIGFKNDQFSALASNMSGGVLGKSTHSQASRSVGDHSKTNNNAGDTNSFGGVVAGRMSDTAQSQGRGGASPNPSGQGVNSGAPGMRGTNEGFGTGTGSDGASSKIICTEMNQAYGFGSFRNAIWMRHAVGQHPAYQRGYHALFRPVLNWARKRETPAQRLGMRVLEWGVKRRTVDIWKQRRGKRDLQGRLLRAIFENLCYIVGRFL